MSCYFDGIFYGCTYKNSVEEYADYRFYKNSVKEYADYRFRFVLEDDVH